MLTDWVRRFGRDLPPFISNLTIAFMWENIKKFFSRWVLKESYSILFLILFLAILLSSACINGYWIEPNICDLWLQDFLINLVAEVLGILLVVFSITRTVQQNREREKKKFREIAFRQLRFVLRKQVSLLFEMYKASCRERPETDYESLPDLFTDRYYEDVQNLDLFKMSPVLTPQGKKMDWLDYLSYECSNLRNALGRVVDRYSFNLDSNVVDALEEVSDAAFIRFISSVWEAKKLNGINSRGDLLSECDRLLREYTASLLKLIALYNDSVPGDRQIVLDRSQWNDWWNHNGRPQIGDSRIKVDSKPS